MLPRPRSPEFKQLGGSDSDHFNQIVTDQALQALWVANSDEEQRDRQYLAATAAMIGAKPAERTRGHAHCPDGRLPRATMECYRRGMLAEQSFEGRHSTSAPPASCLEPTRCCSTREPAPRQGPAGGPGRACHRPGRRPGHRRQRHPGGRGPPGNEDRAHALPMHQSPRCGARTRTGSACRSPAVSGKRRCRMHGGAKGSGARAGNRNALKHGRYSLEASSSAVAMRELVRENTEKLGRRDMY